MSTFKPIASTLGKHTHPCSDSSEYKRYSDSFDLYAARRRKAAHLFFRQIIDDGGFVILVNLDKTGADMSDALVIEL